MRDPFYHYSETLNILGYKATLKFDNGSKRWINRLNKFEDRLDHLEPVLEKWYDYMLGSFERTFQAQGRPKWASLSEYTIEDRIRQGYSASPILDRSGNYRNVANHMEATITNDSIEIKSNIETDSGYNLFSLHQGGWQAPSGKRVPARELNVQDRDKGEFTRLLHEYLIEDI